MNFQPGYHVDPVRIKLSEVRQQQGEDLLPAQLLRQEGSAFLVSIAGRPPVWAWLHDPDLVSQLFEWFADRGIAQYDDQFGLLKVWSGSFFGVVCPQIAAPGQRAKTGEYLADVMRRSTGILN